MDKKPWYMVEGWLEDRVASQLVVMATGLRCIEIGSYKGRSAVAMASSAKSVHCIDTFKSIEDGQKQSNIMTTFDDFTMNIAGYNNITYSQGKSQDVIPSLKGMFDLAFIDGMHDYKDVVCDVKCLLRVMNEGSVFLFHDANLNGVKAAITEMFNIGYGPIESLMWAFKKEINPSWEKAGKLAL